LSKEAVTQSQVSPAARVSLYLGLASLAGFLLSVILGIAVESLGILTLLRSYVTPLSLAAILFSLLARKNFPGGERQARAGWRMGIAALVLVVLATLLAVLFSLPFLLFAGA
jgi:hypothetical protein